MNYQQYGQLMQKLEEIIDQQDKIISLLGQQGQGVSPITLGPRDMIPPYLFDSGSDDDSTPTPYAFPCTVYNPRYDPHYYPYQARTGGINANTETE